jgi:hypothetical protein
VEPGRYLFPASLRRKQTVWIAARPWREPP